MKDSSTQNSETNQLLSNRSPWARRWGGGPVGGGSTGDIMQGGPVKFCSECSTLSEGLHRLALLLRSCTKLRPLRGARLSCRALVRFSSLALELDTVTLWKSCVPLSGRGDTFHHSTEQLLDHSLILILLLLLLFFISHSVQHLLLGFLVLKHFK